MTGANLIIALRVHAVLSIFYLVLLWYIVVHHSRCIVETVASTSVPFNANDGVGF